MSSKVVPFITSLEVGALSREPWRLLHVPAYVPTVALLIHLRCVMYLPRYF